jgi:zinc transport system ATP-binding protein
MLLQAQHLSYAIEWKDIINDLSFTIEKNQVVSIIWYNGSWKSTLLKLLLWTLTPTIGSIIKSSETNIWYVPQKLSFINQLPITVNDFIDIYNWKNNQTQSLSCSFLNIEELWSNLLSSLSGGQLQKVLIYNALLGKPTVLLLDEPTAWLDVVAQKEFYTLIDHIYKEHATTIILVSHDIHTVYSKSDTVICLHKWKCCSWSPNNVDFSNQVSDLLWGYVAPYLHLHKKQW